MRKTLKFKHFWTNSPLIRPIPTSQVPPKLNMPLPFLEDTASEAPRTPGLDVTGPVPIKPTQVSIPFEELMRSLRPGESVAPAFSPAAPATPQTQPSAPVVAPAQSAPARGATGISGVAE